MSCVKILLITNDLSKAFFKHNLRFRVRISIEKRTAIVGYSTTWEGFELTHHASLMQRCPSISMRGLTSALHKLAGQVCARRGLSKCLSTWLGHVQHSMSGFTVLKSNTHITNAFIRIQMKPCGTTFLYSKKIMIQLRIDEIPPNLSFVSCFEH